MKMFSKFSIGASMISLVVGLSGQLAFAAGPATVNLGTAGNFVILAKTGISTTGSTSIVGDLGVSPAEATYITGFDLDLSAASAFSTSALVTGKIYAPGYADPTPANITTAVSNMETAYTDAAGRTNPTATELGAGNIGGMTLAPGLYKWSTEVTIPTDVTLSGGANDVWIFQIAQNLTISSNTRVVLSGGAQARNIFWQVAGQTTLGTGSDFKGIILDQTTIVLQTGATLNGRALAQAAVTLDANVVTIAAAAAASNTPSDTTAPVNTYIMVNGGATVATSNAVTLTPGAVDSSGVASMLISNDSSFTGATWETYTATKNWTLASGDGLKTVYAKFKDAVGNISAVVSSTITLNTAPNAVVPPVSPAVSLAVSPASPTIEQLQQQINLLVSAIQQAQAGKSGKVPPGLLSKALNIGSKGNEVTVLQNFLKAQGVYPEGLITGFFGSLTKKAVGKLQEKYGIANPGDAGYGNVGPKTRAKVNELSGQ